MSKMQIFWCDKCQKKHFFDEVSDGIHVANVQKTLPFLDPETQKKKQSVFTKRKARHKCLHCGFIMKEIHDAGRNNPS